MLDEDVLNVDEDVTKILDPFLEMLRRECSEALLALFTFFFSELQG